MNPVLRLLGRLIALAFVLFVVGFVGLQYARIIGRNVAMERQLHGLESDVAQLRSKRADQDRTIRRLEDPSGVIPEIHDRLRLVGPHEAIVYLKK